METNEVNPLDVALNDSMDILKNERTLYDILKKLNNLKNYRGRVFNSLISWLTLNVADYNVSLQYQTDIKNGKESLSIKEIDTLIEILTEYKKDYKAKVIMKNIE